MSKNIRNVFVSNHTANGLVDEYQAYGLNTTDPAYVIVTVNKAVQPDAYTFTILSNFKIKFNTPPVAGSDINIYSFTDVAANSILGPGDNVTTITKTTHITDGIKNTFLCNGASITSNNTIVTAGAGFARSGYVYQYNKDYIISGSNIIFNTTPVPNLTVSVLVFESNQKRYIGGVEQKDNVAVVAQHELSADGIKDTYTISGGTSNKSLYCLVALNGRMLEGGVDYIISHNRVKFIKKPLAGAKLKFIIFGSAPASVPPKPLTDRVRYLNKDNNLNERTLYKNYWREQIHHYGMTVNYYSNLTNLSNADIIYGEAPLAGYSEPYELNIILKIDNETSLFSKFGYVSDTDATGYIHHEDYQEVFGVGTEPKAGDLIEFTEVGIDRLNYPKRGPRIMEIVEKNDEIPGEINNLAGHYIWQIKLKRFDYSREKTIIPELGSPEPETTGETIPGVPNPIEELSKQVFDYEKSLCSNDSVYGDY